MFVAYHVKGKVTKSDTEKRSLYNGPSAKRAFDYLDSWSEEAEVTVEIWEDGVLVRTLGHKEK